MSHSPSMSTARYLSLKSSSNGSASNSATVLPNTKQDVEKAEMVPPRQGISLPPTFASRLTLPLAYRQIIALHRKAPDQQDIEEWERARVNLKLRWCKLFLACHSIFWIGFLGYLVARSYRVTDLSFYSVFASMFSSLLAIGFILFFRGRDIFYASASDLQDFDQDHPWLFLHDVFYPEFLTHASAAALLVAVVDAIRDAFTK